jgi:sugar (pentulose or hexulose) kinase
MWHFHHPIKNSEVLLHQSDYIVRELVQRKQENVEVYCSDWNNALKLGYDVVKLSYPAWLEKCLQDAKISKTPEEFLPRVVEPGKCIGKLSSNFTKHGYSADCEVVGGTTDSIAAFLASGASEPGQAVTSLGSTL